MRTVCLILILPFCASYVQAQTAYSLGALANRAEDVLATGTAASAQRAAYEAEYLRYAGDYGLTFRAGGEVFLNSDNVDLDTQAGYRGALDLVWELLDGGLAEARFEARRLSNLRDAFASQAEQSATEVRLFAREQALTILQAEAQAAAAQTAVALADTVSGRLADLYQTQDVLRSDALAAELLSQRYAADAIRYGALGERLRDELARRLRIDAGFVIDDPAGLPPLIDEADLVRLTRLQAQRAAQAIPLRVPAPSLGDVRLSVYAGYVLREAFTPDQNTIDSYSFSSGPRLGARLAVPLDVFTRAASTRREQTAYLQQQQAQGDAQYLDRQQRVSQALSDYIEARSAVAMIEQEVLVREATLDEQALQAAEGTRRGVTPNDILLFRARSIAQRAEAEIQRLEAWRQYYTLNALAGLP